MTQDAPPSGSAERGQRWKPPALFGTWVGFLGSIASIIAIPLAYYFYQWSVRAPELLYGIYPNRTTVVQAGQTSGLRVFFGDKPIATDVTAAQVVVWNNGRQPIKPPDVLRELKITTEPRVPILEATVRQQTREVIDFALDTSRLAGGEVGLHFRILERSDGAIVQLIYAGRPDHSINVDGVIEAQGTPRSMDLAKRPRDRTVLVLFATSVLFSLATLTSLVGDVHREWPMRNRTPYHRTSIRVSVALILILVLYSGWLLSTVLLPSFLGTEGPPFPIPRK